MKSLSKYYLFGISVGSFLLFAITPLMIINDMWITILPIFNNTVSDYKIWVWKDISAFALTHFLLIILSVIFATKRNKTGIKILSTVYLLNSLFILFVIWLSKLNAQPINEVNISYSFGWIFFIIGIITHLIFQNRFREKH